MENMHIVSAAKKVEAQYVEMKVPLYSYGCEKEVKKALLQLKGIHSVSVDYEQQKVTVWGICDRDQVLDTIKSKRKGACFWGTEGAHKCLRLRSKPTTSSSTRSWMLTCMEDGQGLVNLIPTLCLSKLLGAIYS